MQNVCICEDDRIIQLETYKVLYSARVVKYLLCIEYFF